MTDSQKHKKSSLIKERSGKFCSKRIASLLFCFASVVLSFLYIILTVDPIIAERLPNIIIAFAMLSGGTHALTIPKIED